MNIEILVDQVANEIQNEITAGEYMLKNLSLRVEVDCEVNRIGVLSKVLSAQMR